MSQFLRSVVLSSFILGIGALAGCDRDSTTATDTTPQPTAGERTDQALDRTGEQLDRAADSTGDALKRTADRTGDALGTAVDKTTDASRRAGAEVRGEVTEAARDLAGNVHNMLGEVTEAAMTRGGIDDLIERFSKADRDRIGDVDENAFTALNSEIDQFRDRWRGKYGADFDVDDARAVFNFVTVEGDASNPDRATVIFPARSGMTEVRIPVIRENVTWKIDAPDTLTAQKLADDLISGLRPINAGNPPLPDDRAEGLRSSAQGTMAAIMGQSRSQ